MRPFRYVCLSQDEYNTLADHKRRTTSSRVSDRCLALMLSSKGKTIPELCSLFDVRRNTITDWFDRWESGKLDGLSDKEKSGRPSKLKAEQKKKIIEQAQAVPLRQLRHTFAELLSGQEVSLKTIKRILREAGFVWKRLRNSLKPQRDELMFRFFAQELGILEAQAADGEYDLYFFDETHINLAPNVPYAWQPVGKTAPLPSQKGNSTILGFLSTAKQDFDGVICRGAANSKLIIKVFDNFASKIKKKTVVILDNASIHTANVVKEQIGRWKSKGLLLQFIPAYSPELNKIEILWKHLNPKNS